MRSHTTLGVSATPSFAKASEGMLRARSARRSMVPGVGLEPTRPYELQILSLYILIVGATPECDVRSVIR